jgi:hypothetical protein
MKFPDLGLEDNKDALKLLLDHKYEEVESAIFRESDDISHLNHLEQMDRLRARAKLEALGVPAATDLPCVTDCGRACPRLSISAPSNPRPSTRS